MLLKWSNFNCLNIIVKLYSNKGAFIITILILIILLAALQNQTNIIYTDSDPENSLFISIFLNIFKSSLLQYSKIIDYTTTKCMFKLKEKRQNKIKSFFIYFA